MMLRELVTHEKQCPERIIKYPYYYYVCGFDRIVKFKVFDEHALEDSVKMLPQNTWSSLKETKKALLLHIEMVSSLKI